MVTGPSGVGKGTLIRSLLAAHPGLRLSVSATTRPPRPGEVDGRDYHFLTQEEFEQRLREDEFLEHANYAGNRYGTLRSELAKAVPGASEGVSGLVLEIELQGARQVREALAEAVRVFIAPPSVEALRSRLAGRGTDSPQQMEDRLATAVRELEAQSEFEHVIVNDRLERAARELDLLVARLWSPQA